jgi:hypothetical protein
MVTQEGSRTLILVCRRAFGEAIERVLRREGFGDFQRGGLSLAGTAVEERSDANEAFVLITDVNSAKRLAQILRACPIRGSETGLFELYTVADGLSLWTVLCRKRNESYNKLNKMLNEQVPSLAASA